MVIALIVLALIAVAAFVATKLGVRLPFADRLEMSITKSLALWSQQLNLFMAFVITYVVQNNGTPIAMLTQFLPSAFEPFKGMLSGLIAFLAVSYLRLLPQSKLSNDGQ